MKYEEAAEIRTTSGWCCKTCNSFYGNNSNSEHLARWCCADSKPCETCDGRVNGKRAGYVVCDECLRVSRIEQYSKRERKDWDGESPLYSDRDDEWFMEPHELADYCEERLILPGDLENLQLLLCEESAKQAFDAADFWYDDIAEDQEIPDCDEINEIVNKWRDENVPVTWRPTKYAPTLESLIGVFAKE